MAGLTASGFERKTLDQIKADLEERIKAIFGTANVAPSSVFGQLIGIFSEVVSDVWELAELVYQSQYPNSAVGIALDNVAELNNLRRLAATNTTAHCIVEGTEGTIVPVGTQFRQSSSEETFRTTEEVTITNALAIKLKVSINTESAQPYTLDLSSALGTGAYTSTLSSTLDILNDLMEQINLESYFKAELNIGDEQLTVTTADDDTPMSLDTITANIDLDETWTKVLTEAVNTGEVSAPSNSIDMIDTPVSGLNSVDNLLTGDEGRGIETDDEFRLRRIQSLRVVGAGTVPSIEARLLQEVSGVLAVTVKDNRTDVPVAGRPPHSFEAIVTYSDDDPDVEQAIADKLWEVGAAGIETYGNVSKTITDSSGEVHVVSFSKPENRYIHINVEIALHDEEIFPVDGIEAIKEAIQQFGDELDAGDDVIRQRFFTPIYSIPGVGDVSLYEHGATTLPEDPPTYVETNLEMTDTQRAQFSIDRIVVTIV